MTEEPRGAGGLDLRGTVGGRERRAGSRGHEGLRASGGLEEWVRSGYDRAYRTAYMIVRNAADAEEAVSEAYLRAWRFRDSIPDGPGREPWLYRVLVNTCNSKLRQEIPRRDRTVDLDGPAPRLAAVGTSPSEAAERADAAGHVGAALSALPEHLRVVVVLRFWTGLSEREIATAIQRRPGTVKSRLAEARRRLALDPRLRHLAEPERFAPVAGTTIDGQDSQ